MSLSKDKKDEIIKNLRERCNYSFIVPPVMPASGMERNIDFLSDNEARIKFYQQVKVDVDAIVARGYNKNIVNWGSRCQSARIKNNHKQQEAADIIGISRKSLQLQEDKNEVSTVDPFYLEVFSLLYNESPYTLLGLQRQEIFPVKTTEDTLFLFMNAIITSLYDESSCEKTRYMELINKIARFSDEAQAELVRFLKKTKVFANIFRRDVLKSAAAHDDSWQKNNIARLFLKEPSPKRRELRELYVDLVSALQYLENRRSPRLEELAQLAILDETTARIVQTVLSAIIDDAGFPKVEEKSIRSDIPRILPPLP